MGGDVAKFMNDLCEELIKDDTLPAFKNLNQEFPSPVSVWGNIWHMALSSII